MVSCLSGVSSLGDRQTSIPAVFVGKKTLSVIYISWSLGEFYWVFTAVLYLNHLAFALVKIGFRDRMIFFCLLLLLFTHFLNELLFSRPDIHPSSFELFVDVCVWFCRFICEERAVNLLLFSLTDVWRI